MPTYDFNCPKHGEFEASVTFANSDQPQPCPAITGTGGHCKARGHKPNKKHQHTIYPILCGKKCKRVARLYPANISYCDGMSKHPAVIDSENTKKYGHTV